MRTITRVWALAFVTMAIAAAALSGPGALGAEPPVFNGDPDLDQPTMHIQPPALKENEARPGLPNAFSTINGIFFTDALLSAGFDFGGTILGYEPSIAVNPLNPNQVALTAFSGSSWASGGNSSIFYSADAGNSWSYTTSVPPPPGTSTDINCPCDQTLDWGRDGLLSGTFLWYSFGGATHSIYTATTNNPTSAPSWTYRTSGGLAQSTSQPGLDYVDQPWVAGGPLPSDNSKSLVCVAYDNFDISFGSEEMRTAASHGSTPLDFSVETNVNTDGQAAGDGMNPGHRIAIGPGGVVFDLFQRWGFNQSGGVKTLTYLLSASGDGGQTWSVANSDHISGAKIIASGMTFQGNGSKVGGVNALLGGITAITVDPATGVAWLVYGTRPTLTGADRLFLVSATRTAGSLALGTARQISPAGLSSYLPSVAVLPNGEIGVLFMTYDGASFGYRFIQTNDGGATIAKTTTLTTFTSPFTNNGQSNQRILGDYLQVRAAGCSFYGTFPAKGAGVNSATSIDPYFMRAPSFAACSLPSLTQISPRAVCAGGPGFTDTLTGTGFLPAGNGRMGGAVRTTSFTSSTQAQVTIPAADIAAPGIALIDYLGAPPAGGLTTSLPLAIEPPAASPGSSLRASKTGANVHLLWTLSANASSYNVKRCQFNAPCTPVPIAAPVTNAFDDPVLGDGRSYWYLIDSVNSCGSVP